MLPRERKIIVAQLCDTVAEDLVRLHDRSKGMRDEDDQLVTGIIAMEVGAGIGFREACILCLAQGFRR